MHNHIVCRDRDRAPSMLGTWLQSLLPTALIISLIPAYLERAKAKAGVGWEGLGKAPKDESSFMRKPVGLIQPTSGLATSKPLSWNVPSA